MSARPVERRVRPQQLNELLRLGLTVWFGLKRFRKSLEFRIGNDLAPEFHEIAELLGSFVILHQLREMMVKPSFLVRREGRMLEASTQ